MPERLWVQMEHSVSHSDCSSELHVSHRKSLALPLDMIAWCERLRFKLCLSSLPPYSGCGTSLPQSTHSDQFLFGQKCNNSVTGVYTFGGTWQKVVNVTTRLGHTQTLFYFWWSFLEMACHKVEQHSHASIPVLYGRRQRSAKQSYMMQCVTVPYCTASVACILKQKCINCCHLSRFWALFLKNYKKWILTHEDILPKCEMWGCHSD